MSRARPESMSFASKMSRNFSDAMKTRGKSPSSASSFNSMMTSAAPLSFNMRAIANWRLHNIGRGPMFSCCPLDPFPNSISSPLFKRIGRGDLAEAPGPGTIRKIYLI